MFVFVNRICYICVSKFIVMEYEERKIAKVYAIVTLYTIILLVGGILLGFAMGKQSVISETQQSDTPQVERVTPFP